MGFRSKVTAAALGAAGFAALVSAQGFYFDEDMKADCAGYNQRYLGCFAVTAAPFPWTPVNQDLSLTGDLSKSWTHWITSTTWNTTNTPNFCLEVCRAHGHKYAALWNLGECSCGSTLDYTNQAGVAVRLSNQLQATDALCTSASDPCPGDRLEACGTGLGARIWVDPSFEGVAAEADVAALAAGYEQLGCFQDPNFPTSQVAVTAPNANFPSASACFAYCADLGKPYVYMNANAGDNGQ